MDRAIEAYVSRGKIIRPRRCPQSSPDGQRLVRGVSISLLTPVPKISFQPYVALLIAACCNLSAVARDRCQRQRPAVCFREGISQRKTAVMAG